MTQATSNNTSALSSRAFEIAAHLATLVAEAAAVVLFSAAVSVWVIVLMGA